MLEPDCEQLTLSAAGFPASPFPLPGSDEARMMTVTSGLKCLELYRKSGPLGCLARMLLESSIWHSTRCALTWKAKATKSNRLLFQLAVSMRRTKGTGCLLLPTPTTQNAKHGAATDWEKENRPNHLHVIASMWPTPTADSASNRTGRYAQGGLPLTAAVQMWPTPRATDGGHSGPNQRDSKGKPALAGAVGGQLNPDWVDWLMGFPPGWSDIGE
jgi:hypothetical protein